ncbi:MAG: hypothetical protein F2923_02660 [Actinobacteria bacterium]|uniref:Unannotated protein n=1 Tax=freshwater metagenome TaxID=449393 RepID=A0A6J7S6X2_9ZZZZ|nr:hypothetical protein [Actinomycetota bacterium]MTB27522.1 hypothetical protein [Actinomycetota bacterium]
MTIKSTRRRRSFTAIVSCSAALTVLGLVGGSIPAFGFGSTDSWALGQNSEHQHITESLGIADPLWNKKSLILVAGNSGNYGAVAAADRATDSSATLIKGLGPGYKHCDDGDWLDIPGYPHNSNSAVAELTKCADYYQYLLDRAVRYAGQLVTPEMKVSESVFTMTSGSGTFKPDTYCAYRFSLTPDNNPKCDVLNAFGRSLHVAEDVWSHTNWGDQADPAKSISITNPPGLGNTEIPGFLHYPASITIPEGLISGCDDSAPMSDCKNRIGHSALAKDNGKFNPDGSNAQSTDKYYRGLVVVDGVSNFERAITGAMNQAASTWSDLQNAILSKYGDARGNAIISVLRSDSAKQAGLTATELTDQPFVRSQGAPASGEFAADPSQDAPLGSGNKDSDPGHAGLAGESADSSTRQAAGVTLGEQSPTNDVTSSGSNAIVWVVVGAALIILIVIVLVLGRRRSKTKNA